MIKILVVLLVLLIAGLARRPFKGNMAYEWQFGPFVLQWYTKYRVVNRQDGQPNEWRNHGILGTPLAFHYWPDSRSWHTRWGLGPFLVEYYPSKSDLKDWDVDWVAAPKWYRLTFWLPVGHLNFVMRRKLQTSKARTS